MAIEQGANEILGTINATAPSLIGNTSANAPSLIGNLSTNATAPITNLGASEALFSWGTYFSSIAMLIFILALLCGALWLIKKTNKTNFLSKHIKNLPRNQLRVEAVLNLGAKRAVYVVQFLNKRLVLGVTDQQINLLMELEKSDDNKPQQDFEELLQESNNKPT